MTLTARGTHDEAEELLGQAWTTFSSVDHPDAAAVAARLVEHWDARGDVSRAAEWRALASEGR